MFFIGLDLGDHHSVVSSSSATDSFVVAVDTNDLSNRSTPTILGFDGKVILVGEAAESRYTSNLKSTVIRILDAFDSYAEVEKKQAAKDWLWAFAQNGDEIDIGPLVFNDKELMLSPTVAMALLLKKFVSFGKQRHSPADDKPFTLVIAVGENVSAKAVVGLRAAAALAALDCVSIIRSSQALAVAYAHKEGADLADALTEENPVRNVMFFDMGYSHATATVVQYTKTEAVSAEVLATECAAGGVYAVMRALAEYVLDKVEAKHGQRVDIASKRGVRLMNAVQKSLKELSMGTESTIALECFLPDDVDISVDVTRDLLEQLAASTLDSVERVVAGTLEKAGVAVSEIQLVGGGTRMPSVLKRVTQAPTRTGLDGSSSISVGATLFAAGKTLGLKEVSVEMTEVPTAQAELLAELESVSECEVKRLAVRNELEGYLYSIRDLLSGSHRNLMKPETVEPHLNALELFLEDAEMAEVPPTLEVFEEKFASVKAFIETECSEYYKMKADENERREKELIEAAAAEKKRREELGMDFDKDERKMSKEERIKLSQKNKQEGTDMFKANKFDDAIRRYKKAMEHLRRPEMLANQTPDDKAFTDEFCSTCHLNVAMCYLKAASQAKEAGKGKNEVQPLYKKAKVSCTEALELVVSVKGLYRRATCSEHINELSDAIADVKKASALDENDQAVKKYYERLLKLQQAEKDRSKKVFSKMFA